MRRSLFTEVITEVGASAFLVVIDQLEPTIYDHKRKKDKKKRAKLFVFSQSSERITVAL